MTVWLMSIVGIVSVGVLLDIILEDSELSKYIRGIFGIAVVLVLVMPLPNLFNKKWNFDDIFDSEYEVNSGFVQDIEREYIRSEEDKLTAHLEENGIEVISVHILCHSDSRAVKAVRMTVKGDSAVAQRLTAEYLEVAVDIVRVYSG